MGIKNLNVLESTTDYKNNELFYLKVEKKIPILYLSLNDKMTNWCSNNTPLPFFLKIN